MHACPLGSLAYPCTPPCLHSSPAPIRVRIEAKTKHSIALLAAVLQSPSLSHPSMPISVEDLECLLAVLIHKGLIKGFISHTPLYLVNAKAGAFPFPWTL